MVFGRSSVERSGREGVGVGVRHHVFVFECHSFIFVLLYLPHFYTLIVVNVVLYNHRVINHDVVHKSKRHPRLHKTIQVSSSGTGKLPYLNFQNLFYESNAQRKETMKFDLCSFFEQQTTHGKNDNECTFITYMSFTGRTARWWEESMSLPSTSLWCLL